MPAKKLSPERLADAARLKSIFNERKGDLGLTQATLADELGFANQSAVSQYLNGNIPLNPEAAIAFATRLGCSVSDISPTIQATIDHLAQYASGATDSTGSVPCAQARAAGARLAQERLRLGLSQERFGAIVGVSRSSQARYESGIEQPDVVRLEAMAKAGTDVLYIITGNRAVTPEDLAADLKRYGDAWETLELALNLTRRTLSPEKKRKGAEAMFRTSKAQMAMNQGALTELIVQLAA